MEERAKLPVSLPRINPTTSYWQDPPDAHLSNYLSSESLPGQVVDTVVIGSGISGAAIAWNILDGDDGQRKQRVVMLEARTACSGATGRNGGHTKAASYRSFPSNVKELGLEEAKKIARLELSNIKAVHAFAREHKIDCESRECDTVDIIYDRAQWEECVSAIQLIRQSFSEPGDEDSVARYNLWTPEEARDKFLVKGTGTEGESIKGAVSYAAGSLSAYKFTIGILRLCLEKGLEIYTQTPAFSCKKIGEEWHVKTERGTIKAQRVVLATNGYSAFLVPELQGTVVPLRGQITAHRPGSGMLERVLETTYSFIYKDGYEYMIPRPQGSQNPGDIIIGGGLVKAPEGGISEFGTTDDTTMNTDLSKYLYDTTSAYFGESWGEDHPEGRIRKEWTGIMGYSSDGLPLVGEFNTSENKSNFWLSVSFQGHGMVLCWMCAKALVCMMENETKGESVENVEKLESWFPEAFRFNEERLKTPFMGRRHTKAGSGEEGTLMQIDNKAGGA
ncbi:FAD dependent oxidoreductase-domain-containing protein [Tricladium varicosporioides]|nr:FAD dependent oxidoreductase-domain-containing protein [Hymenoscyphus varicosporioides]